MKVLPWVLRIFSVTMRSGFVCQELGGDHQQPTFTGVCVNAFACYIPTTRLMHPQLLSVNF